jgi:single-strand DNA-binding protein
LKGETSSPSKLHSKSSTGFPLLDSRQFGRVEAEKNNTRKDLKMNINKLFFGGPLVRDPEMKFTTSGTVVCNFTIAANYSRKTDAKEYKEVCFLNCVLFGKMGEMVADKFKKGQNILIEGRMKTESWETESGKRSAQKCMVEKIHFTDTKKQSSESTSEDQPTQAAGSEEDIPF